MAIDPIKVDNPLDREAVPKDRMPIEFPARFQFDVVVFLSALLSSIAVAGAIYFVAFHAARFSPTMGSWLNESARIAHVAFVLCIMMRWVTKSGYAYRMALISALFSLASTACVTNLGNEKAVVFCAFTMTSSIWIMVEIGSHFESIDCCILRADPKLAERRRNRSSGQLEILAALIGIGICISLWSPIRLVMAPVIIVAAILIAFVRSAKVAKYPIQFLLLTCKHYFAYPNSSTLAPGLIRSCAPDAILRTMPMAVYVVVVITLPLAIPMEGDAVTNTFVWGSIGAGLGLSLLVLAASFTAWTVHFNDSRAPFDVIIKQLRGTDEADE